MSAEESIANACREHALGDQRAEWFVTDHQMYRLAREFTCTFAIFLHVPVPYVHVSSFKVRF